MHERDRRPPSTSASAAVGFSLLSVLMSPVSAIGYILWIVKGVLLSSKSGVS